MQGKVGQWVQIRNTVLHVGERAAQIPEETQATPLMMWVKGYLVIDAEVGKECTVTTPTGREVQGILEEIEPGYIHDFGGYVPELDVVRWQVKEMLTGASLKGGTGG